MIAGADRLIDEVSADVDPRDVRVVRAACVGRCDAAPAARVGDREVDNATVDGLLRLARGRRTDVVVPKYIALDEYLEGGGYELLKTVRSGALGAEAIIKSCKPRACAASAARASRPARNGSSSARIRSPA